MESYVAGLRAVKEANASLSKRLLAQSTSSLYAPGLADMLARESRASLSISGIASDLLADVEAEQAARRRRRRWLRLPTFLKGRAAHG